MLTFVAAAALAYAVLPSDLDFVVLAAWGLGSQLALIYWLFFSPRVRPQGVGRRLAGSAQIVSAWDALRGRRPSAA